MLETLKIAVQSSIPELKLYHCSLISIKTNSDVVISSWMPH